MGALDSSSTKILSSNSSNSIMGAIGANIMQRFEEREVFSAKSVGRCDEENL